MPISEDELDKKRAKVEKLRENLAEAQFLREEREREASRDLEAKQLDAEAARLEGELNIAKEMAKVGTIKAGTADLAEVVTDGPVVTEEPAPVAAKE